MAGAGRVRRSRRLREAPHRRAAAAAGVAPEDWRDWAGGVPAEVLGKVAEKLNAAETRGPGSTLMAVTCKGWKNTLKEDAIKAAGGPEVWRDWGNRYGEGLPATVLVKVAGKVVAQTEAGWAAWLKERAWSPELDKFGGMDEVEVELQMAKRKRDGNCLFVFARVCKEWRKAQLKVGGRLRTRVQSDVLLPGQVALAKWALAEGCPRKRPAYYNYNMAEEAARHGHLDLIKWLCGEGGFAMDEMVMQCAAKSGNLELVRWLRGEGCPWDWTTCYQAVKNGHVEMLRWIRANGCPWDEETRDLAAAELGYTDDFGNLVGYYDEFSDDESSDDEYSDDE